MQILDIVEAIAQHLNMCVYTTEIEKGLHGTCFYSCCPMSTI